MRRERARLYREGLDHTHVEVSIQDEEYVVSVDAPQHLLEHPVMLANSEPPEGLAKHPRLLARVESGERLVASKALVRDLDVHKDIAGMTLRSVQYQLSVASVLQASFLTNRAGHVDVIRNVSAAEGKMTRRSLTPTELNAALPIAADVPTSKIVTVRNHEREAFVRFRGALSRAIDERRDVGGDLPMEAARELYANILAPEVARLDQTVAKAKRDLIRGPLAALGALVGVITIGTYSGLLTGQVAQVAQAIGWSGVAFQTLKSALEGSNVHSGAKSDPLYFLWRMREQREADVTR